MQSVLLSLISIVLFGACATNANPYSVAFLWFPGKMAAECSEYEWGLIRWGAGFAYQNFIAEETSIPVSDIEYEDFKLTKPAGSAQDITVDAETIEDLYGIHLPNRRQRVLKEGEVHSDLDSVELSAQEHRRLDICDKAGTEYGCYLGIDCSRRNLRQNKRQLTPAENRFRDIAIQVYELLAEADGDALECLGRRTGSLQAELEE